MEPWWEIHYFERKDGYTKLNNSMVPFKLLPELGEMDLRKGHTFKTDQFEIVIPGTNISLHMPTCSLWIGETPYIVEKATRVILFNRNFNRNDGASWREICLGLSSEDGSGIIIKYNTSSGKAKIHEITNKSRSAGATFHDQVKLPDLDR